MKVHQFVLDERAIARISGHNWRDYQHLDVFAYRDCQTLALTKMGQWARENCLGMWHWNLGAESVSMSFTEAADAMRFKLTWM